MKSINRKCTHLFLCSGLSQRVQLFAGAVPKLSNSTFGQRRSHRCGPAFVGAEIADKCWKCSQMQEVQLPATVRREKARRNGKGTRTRDEEMQAKSIASRMSMRKWGWKLKAANRKQKLKLKLSWNAAKWIVLALASPLAVRLPGAALTLGCLDRPVTPKCWQYKVYGTDLLIAQLRPRERFPLCFPFQRRICWIIAKFCCHSYFQLFFIFPAGIVRRSGASVFLFGLANSAEKRKQSTFQYLCIEALRMAKGAWHMLIISFSAFFTQRQLKPLHHPHN